MAQKFVGFKPETIQNKILPALGYNGPTDEKSINLFLAANPAAAAKMGKYTMAARQMVEGKPMKAASGVYSASSPSGVYTPSMLGIKTGPPPSSSSSSSSSSRSAPTPVYTAPVVQSTGISPTQVASPTSVPSPTTASTGVMTGSQTTRAIQQDPTKPVTTARVVAGDGGAATQVDPNAGSAGPANLAQVTTATPAGQAVASPQTPAGQVTPATSTPAVQSALAGQAAAQGTVSPEAQMAAAQGDPTQLAALQLEAAQLGQAQTVDAPLPLEMTTDQTISGSAVDQRRVGQTFGTGEVQAATVQDELSDLMQDFDLERTPSWAAGAMRAANSAMAARGLASSSMAGMAVVQAAMEAALPIAQMDASNKQQMALMKAEQRAKFMGMEFDQEFQTKVKNAARVSEIANINFSADQQIALENARMAQTVDLANLSNRQAKVMSDAAAMSQMDMANLNNRQQANAQNAQAFLQMDMANLDNEQQMTMFKTQANVSSILSDTAADNAAQQFNATSQNQTDQFFAGLATQVSQFNSEQQNAMSRFNAGETNALAQFNAAQENARDQFNAQNHLIIQQANARWAQSITTAENAAQNQANRDAAMVANNLTRAAYDEALQRERDILGWAWKSGENSAERDNAIATARISAAGDGSDGGNAFEKGLGSFAAKLTEAALTNIFL
tara:strand:+ start:10035 stop:12056 length:2022 start_codon:yes stop_codon:yes gene_type:complete